MTTKPFETNSSHGQPDLRPPLRPVEKRRGSLVYKFRSQKITGIAERPMIRHRDSNQSPRLLIPMLRQQPRQAGLPVASLRGDPIA